ncbi:MAG TPA: MGMT family protein [Polyangiaceae bacterium]|nr:MGMT family protein [Polyangiaceae bacterium]
MASSFERIRRVVVKIPRGHVMTYGDVARAAGMPGAARTVGYAMRALGRDVPWQRVLGRKNPRTAHITIQGARGKAEQRRLLEKEGVEFDWRGGISLTDFGWAGGDGPVSGRAAARPATWPTRKKRQVTGR